MEYDDGKFVNVMSGTGERNGNKQDNFNNKHK
jgi:hypothetical protein